VKWIFIEFYLKNKFMVKYILSIFILASIIACKDNKPKSNGFDLNEAKVKSNDLIAQIKQDTFLRDTQVINKVISHAVDLSDNARTDTSFGYFLMQAGKIAKSTGQPGKAIYIWGTVVDYKCQYSPEALFFQGFTIDSDGRDTAMARTYYEKFLTNYPNHPLSVQVNQLLGVLGKSPEDLIKGFQKNK